ncbi:hypothetical protein GCM10010193_05110 [Kitasatospora atroaurantiaca]|uniref:Uncharacterized protein n=1 Tax=Kitasatospora atroaurantiaca TaxID=285545 RepID=A0A561EM79_9ACTN|nr:hypothetical protein [Kitasatospora atroaurantiaca]TWE16724.1 hypothetical protein FB465_1712 [Kitasatospora atroaurantiaca]
MPSDIRPIPYSPTAPTALLIEQPEPIATTASQMSDLAEAAGSLRTRVKYMQEDIGELHQRTLFIAWEKRTTRRGKEAPANLLEALGDLGFAWRDIARMLHVSVPAVQKWRRAGGVTGENRRRIAALLALCDEIADRYHIQEIASWFEMPITSTAPITPIDLYSVGKTDLVFDHASGHVDSEQILTAYDPQWREHFRSDFEVYLEVDGQMSIRPKGA